MALPFSDLHWPRLVPLLGGLLLLAACGKKPVADLPERAVKVMRANADGQHSAPESFSGEVHARTESRLSFRVGGKLISREAQLGQSVHAGQVLAQLDPRDYELGVQAAQAQVQAARTSRDLAAADVHRFESLRNQGFISGAQLEKLQAQLQSAQAQLTQAQAQASVQGNQASYGRLLADHAGVITAVLAEPGQVVGAGQPVVQLAQDGPRDVIFALPEGMQKNWPIGSAVGISNWSANGEPSTQHWAGKVREIAASADPMTRTYTVKITVDAPQTQAPALGSTVRITPIKTASANDSSTGVLLPLSAIKRESGKTVVWIYSPNEGKVHERTVQTTGISGDLVRIGSGLQGDELVVTAGVHTLTEGQKVTRYEGKSPVEAASSNASEAGL